MEKLSKRGKVEQKWKYGAKVEILSESGKVEQKWQSGAKAEKWSKGGKVEHTWNVDHLRNGLLLKIAGSI